MFVMMFIFAVIGMQLFGGCGMSAHSRLHFDNFPSAMVCVTTILLGKYVAIYQAGVEANVGLQMAIFVYVACLVLYLTIVNLFVAILVQVRWGRVFVPASLHALPACLPLPLPLPLPSTLQACLCPPP